MACACSAQVHTMSHDARMELPAIDELLQRLHHARAGVKECQALATSTGLDRTQLLLLVQMIEGSGSGTGIALAVWIVANLGCYAANENTWLSRLLHLPPLLCVSNR